MTEPVPGAAALTKGIQVLKLLSEIGRPANLAHLQKVTGMPKATLHRILQALMSEGLVRQDFYDKTFQLGFGLLRMTRIMLEDLRLPELSRDVLETLRDQTGETVHLAVPEPAGVTYIAVHRSTHPVGTVGTIGSISPYHCSSAGKAIAAFDPGVATRILAADLQALMPATLTDPATLSADLEKTRKRGYATNFEEEFPDVFGIGVPVMDRHGRPVASISITIPGYRFEAERTESIVTAAKVASGQISDRL
ncbi:IclR family transcriptional regulator (plasmid) [Rhodobacteraceae bacterium M382]|nr:IclR family transcriptional regulator [Rhodobacteraceae bacterium M382]